MRWRGIPWWTPGVVWGAWAVEMEMEMWVDAVLRFVEQIVLATALLCYR